MNPFIAHIIGDFILQNDWMAVKKKNHSFSCLIHVIVYLIPFLICDLMWWQILLIGIQHFVQDRTGLVFWWMRVFKRVPKQHWGQIPLLVDQSFHLVFIEIVILIGRHLS